MVDQASPSAAEEASSQSRVPNADGGFVLNQEDALAGVPDELKDAPVTSQTGLAAIALNFALKYADINTVQEGALYQQYKLEGRNMHDLHLSEVFYYAAQIEKHLLQAPSRLALAVLEAVAEDIDAALGEEDASGIEGEAGDRADGLHPEGESPTGAAGDAQPPISPTKD